MPDPSLKERELVRELARGVAEIAASEENRRIQQRWRDVNGLRRPDRAPVWCKPVGAWAELLPESDLVCTDRRLRRVERQFRQALIKHDIGDDSPVEDWFAVNAVSDVDPPNVWGVDVAHRRPAEAGGAWAFDPPLKTEADYDRLRIPQFRYNQAATDRALEQAHQLLGDILPVRRVCAAPLSPVLGTDAAELRGLSEMMLDMAAAPALMHRLMAHLRDANLAVMRQMQESGLLTPNNFGPMICSDPLPPGPDGKLTWRNLWVMANSQEFDQVSPAMWRQFCLDYQMPILRQYGAVAYGCCENLTHKIDGVLSIPNLRIFVCSAWTDLDKVIERVADRHVIMWRQKASEVVFPDDVSEIRHHLQEGMRRLKGCHVQIVLRELQTLAGHPNRLHLWTRLAIEAAAKYS